MAKKRLIPKLQLMPSKLIPGVMSLVTTRQFQDIIEVGDPVSQAKIYEAQAVDELIFVDLSFSKGLGNKETVVNVIRRVAEEVFLPITIGGGIESIEDIRFLLTNGADKVAINTAALENPELIRLASNLFGAQCIVISIDYKKESDGSFKVYSHGGTKKYEMTPLEWALKAETFGAGELLLTSIDHDGMRSGLEHDIAQEVCEKLSIPVIISGGCGQAIHFISGFKDIGADAVSAGTFFCFQDQSPMQTRSHIKNAGISVRIHT